MAGLGDIWSLAIGVVSTLGEVIVTCDHSTEWNEDIEKLVSKQITKKMAVKQRPVCIV